MHGDLSWPTTLRLSLTGNSGPSNAAPPSLSNFLSAYKPQLLLHMVCPSVSLRFTAPLTGTKHLLLLFFWLKVVTSHHSRACQSQHLSKQPLRLGLSLNNHQVTPLTLSYHLFIFQSHRKRTGRQVGEKNKPELTR